jgi:hypothetical protein
MKIVIAENIKPEDLGLARPARAGEVVDVPADIARRLINQGVAVVPPKVARRLAEGTAPVAGKRPAENMTRKPKESR